MIKKNIKFLPVIVILIFYAFIVYHGYLPAELSWQGFTSLMIFLAVIYLWATEILPLPVTALFAILLLGFSGTVPIIDSLYGFGSTVVFLILIGFFLAAGLRSSGLDKRIAYIVLRNSNSETKILFGVIVITFVLSMIMSNTTTTLLMVPIVLHMLDKVKLNRNALLLGVAYAANVGGAGLLIGTPPNLIGAGALGWGFYEWMVAALPFTVVMLLLLLFSLWLYFRPRETEIKKHLIEDLGHFTKKERNCALIILLTMALWISSPLHNVPAIIVGLVGGLLMFLFVYDWYFFEKHTHWGTIILIAGAVSLGHALEITGAASWIALQFLNITGFAAPVLIAFSFVVLAMFITQFIQNTATATMIVPVLASLAGVLGISAVGLVVPVTIAVSMTFLMPPGTAPNAIVHSMGRIKSKEMVKAGILPTIFALILLFIYCTMLF